MIGAAESFDRKGGPESSIQHSSPALDVLAVRATAYAQKRGTAAAGGIGGRCLARFN